MNPNAVMGLGSKLNTSEIIDRFIKIEKRRLQPVEQRKEEKLQQVDAWAALQTEIKMWTQKILNPLHQLQLLWRLGGKLKLYQSSLLHTQKFLPELKGSLFDYDSPSIPLMRKKFIDA